MAKGGFRGGYGGMGGMSQANMMKQAQKMQAELAKMQTELEQSSFTATAGGGAVKAVVNGKHELTALEIDPDAVDPEDVEMLQDMVIAAVNEALRKVDEASSANMSRLTGMKGLPF
ncbi:MAG TPA: YbaB/EbfC family nucleoid-associated protein [Candidatus Scatomorpha stercoravium]|nr:YbaB/EbfC family nucleoid-associated protein [Candidatus Scatomorpha stercoravium]